MKIYAGIGSRETPNLVLQVFENIGNYLATQGYTLRSGGADGADLAFEIGSNASSGKKEIYLPWNHFNGSDSLLYHISHEAYQMASQFHPRWDRLSQGAKKLQARNCYQVLGRNLDTPVDFIVCYTPGGSASGGTGQAIRIAKEYNIPVFDAGAYKNIDLFRRDLFDFIQKSSVGANS